MDIYTMGGLHIHEWDRKLGLEATHVFVFFKQFLYSNSEVSEK